MFCPKCNTQLPDGSKFCSTCGTNLTEAVAPQPVVQPVAQPVVQPVAQPVVQPEVQPVAQPEVATPAAKFNFKELPSKKKRGILIGAGAVGLVAVLLIVSFVFGFFGLGRGSATDMWDAAFNVVEEGNFTIKFTATREYYGDYADEYSYDPETFVIKIDKDKGELIVIEEWGDSEIGERYVTTTGYDRSGEYRYRDYGTKHGYAYIDTNDDVSEAIPAILDAYEVAYELFETDEVDIDAILNLALADEMNLTRLMDKYDIDEDDAEEILQDLYDKINDDEWLEENLDFEFDAGFVEHTYSISLNEYDVEKLVLGLAYEYDLISKSVYNEEIDDIERYEEEYGNDDEITIKIFVSFDEIVGGEFKYADDDSAEIISFSITDVGDTEVGVDALKNKIDNANEGYTVCRKCNNNDAVLNGYCESCYHNEFCSGLCGNYKTDGCDGHCSDCYVECNNCHQRHAEYLNDFDNKYYCYSCDRKLFCEKHKCDKVIFKDSRCEEHFTPCVSCGEKHASRTHKEGGKYCYECYDATFCSEYDCGERIYKDGYCREHFVPCVNCGQKYGADYRDGYCYDCYYNSYY